MTVTEGAFTIAEDRWRVTPHSFAEHVSGGSCIAYRHHKLVGYFLYLLGVGLIDRLGVTLPVGSGKSFLTSWWFPVWTFHHFPSDRFILASYEATFAEEWGKLVRGTLDEHPELGVQLRPDSQAANRWRTNKGGGMWTAGAGGAITGRRAKKFLIDDPHKNFQEAHSPTVQESIYNFYRSTARTRLLPHAGVGLVMSRWCENDLTGQIQKSPAADRWVWVHLPAVAVDDETIETVIGAATALRLREKGIPLPEWHRGKGEALWPTYWNFETQQWEAWFDESELAEIRQEVGEYIFAGMYQGDPSPAEGGMFKRHNWAFTDVAPVERLDLVRRWDLAGTEGGGDWTAGVLMGRAPNGTVFVLDVRRIQGGPDEVDRFVLATAQEDRRRYDNRVVIRLEQEPGSSGKSVAEGMVKDLLAGFDVKAQTSSGDKALRARPLASQQGVGNVYLVREQQDDGSFREPEWWQRFIDEAAGFDAGAAHDDMVDAASLAYTDLAELARARRRSRVRTTSVAGRQLPG